MGRQLLEQLLDPIFLTHRVDVGHLVVRQRREVEVDLHRERELSNFLIRVFFQRKLIMSDNFPSPSVIISNNSGLGYE